MLLKIIYIKKYCVYVIAQVSASRYCLLISLTILNASAKKRLSNPYKKNVSLFSQTNMRVGQDVEGRKTNNVHNSPRKFDFCYY